MRTITKISTRTFVIIRHLCHICIYLLIFIIITVLGFFLWCTITPFIDLYLLSLFLVIFTWFWTFINQIIYRFASKCFARCTFIPLLIWITRRMRCLLICLKYFSTEWLAPPQKVYFFWTGFLSNYFYQNLNCYQDSNSQSREI